MDINISTTIENIHKEGDNYRITLIQKSDKSKFEVTASILVTPSNFKKLNAAFPPIDFTQPMHTTLDCIIEDEKHLTFIFPVYGTFAEFPYTLGYPIKATLNSLVPERSYDLSSFKVFSDEPPHNDEGDYFFEEYFLSLQCLYSLKDATGAKEFSDLIGTHLTVKADGLCYFKTHLSALDISFSVNVPDSK